MTVEIRKRSEDCSVKLAFLELTDAIEFAEKVLENAIEEVEVIIYDDLDDYARRRNGA